MGSAAGARCADARRSCCNFLPVRYRRVTNVLEPGIPDLCIARSILANSARSLPCIQSTAPKSGGRILRPDNCGVKAKGTIYRGLFADLWKSVTERQMLSQRRGIVLALLDSRFHRERAERQRERAEAPMPSAVLDRKPPDVYSIGPSLNGR